MKHLERNIAYINKILIRKLKKKFPNQPYTAITVRWDDGTFKVEVQTVLHDMPQYEAVRQFEYTAYMKKYTWRRGTIEYSETETIERGHFYEPPKQTE